MKSPTTAEALLASVNLPHTYDPVKITGYLYSFLSRRDINIA